MVIIFNLLFLHYLNYCSIYIIIHHDNQILIIIIQYHIHCILYLLNDNYLIQFYYHNIYKNPNLMFYHILFIFINKHYYYLNLYINLYLNLYLNLYFKLYLQLYLHFHLSCQQHQVYLNQKNYSFLYFYYIIFIFYIGIL